MNLPYNHPASRILSAAISDASDNARRIALHYLCGVLDIARPGEIQPDRLRADLILQLLQKDEHPELVKTVETPALTPDSILYCQKCGGKIRSHPYQFGSYPYLCGLCFDDLLNK